MGGQAQTEDSSAKKDTPAIDVEAWRRRIREDTFSNYHYEMGVALRRSGALEPALAAFARALEQAPAMIEARLNLAFVLRDLGRATEADQIERQATAEDPSFLVNAQHRIARRYFETGNIAEADEVCRSTLTLDPGHATTRVLGAVLRLVPPTDSANTAWATDPVRLSEAEALLSFIPPQAPETDPLLGRDLFMAGRRMLRYGHSALSQRLFEWALAFDPGAEDVRLYVDLSRLNNGQTAEKTFSLPALPAAWAASDTAGDYASELAMDLFHVAAAVYLTGRATLAQRMAEMALSIRPGLTQAYAHIGNILRSQRKRIEAMRFLQRAKVLDPKNASTLIVQGHLLQALGHPEDGIASVRQALALAPKQPSFTRSLGMVLAYSGRFGDAVEAFDEALALDPNIDAVRDYRVLALLAQDKLDEAERTCREFLAERPRSARLRSNLGLVLHARGRIEEAVAEYGAALQGDGTAGWERSSHGLGLLALGRLNEAEAAHREALASEPNNAWCHINLALTLEARNRQEESLEAARNGVEAAPDQVRFHAKLRPWAAGTLTELLKRCGMVPFA